MDAQEPRGPSPSRPSATDPVDPYSLDAMFSIGTEAFAAGLAERTALPDRRVAAFVRLSDAELRGHRDAASQTLERFELALSGAGPTAVDELVRDLDPRRVSRDHQWREIFAWIRSNPRESHELRRLTVGNYAEYLGSCCEMLESISARRRAIEETGKDTQVVRAFQDEIVAKADLTRLPTGESVELSVPYRGELALWLGRHRFLVLDGFPLRLLDPAGVAHAIGKGRQSLGRSPSNDLAVGPDFGDVSRTHLVIDWSGGAEIRVTDVSSLGTFTEPVEAPAETDDAVASADEDAERSSITESTTGGKVKLAVVPRAPRIGDL